MSLLRPIHHTFAPLGTRDQVKLAISLLHQRSDGKETTSREALRGELKTRFQGDVFLFASGRESLASFLNAVPHEKGDEVIVQAYTCVVVPNAIEAAGFVPVYCDIEKDTLNLDPKSLECAITPKTRAVICQHTFGIPAPVEELRAICDRHHVLLIEDCAHILPDSHGPRDVTQLGDALLLSFGRDKAVSGVAGGAVIARKAEFSAAIREQETKATDLDEGTVRHLILYPILYAIARPFYGLGIGKIFLLCARKTRLLVPILSGEEKRGHQSPLLHRFPEPCAALALQQWRKLKDINDHRRACVAQYLNASADHGWPVLHAIRSDLPLQKFPMFVRDAKEVRKKLRRQNIHLDDGWTGCVVCPSSVDPIDAMYKEGTDPTAEQACEEILSLPTHPGMTEHDVKRLTLALEGALAGKNLR